MATRRRISFSDYDAAHLYELAAEHFCVSKKEGICPVCLTLKKRLEKFVGEKGIKRMQRQLKKYPYLAEISQEEEKKSIAAAERDYKAGRVHKISSLKDLRKSK